MIKSTRCMFSKLSTNVSPGFLVQSGCVCREKAVQKKKQQHKISKVVIINCRQSVQSVCISLTFARREDQRRLRRRLNRILTAGVCLAFVPQNRGFRPARQNRGVKGESYLWTRRLDAHIFRRRLTPPEEIIISGVLSTNTFATERRPL